MLDKLQRGRASKPPRIMCYGVEGIGKSTFGSQAPKPVFVQTEDGLDEIDCDRFPIATKFEEVVSALADLGREQHDYETVVLDSADWLERLIFDRLCAEHNTSSIEQVAGGFSKGYTLALTYWREILSHLDALRNQRGMVVLLIAHSKVERFEDPESSPYDRYTPRLHKHAAGSSASGRMPSCSRRARSALSRRTQGSTANARSPTPSARRVVNEFCGASAARPASPKTVLESPKTCRSRGRHLCKSCPATNNRKVVAMADLNGFDANDVEPRSDLEPIPAGKYPVVITDSEMKPNKAGTGSMLVLTFQITEGDYQNRLLWARLNLDHPNATAVQIARADLSAICRAVGVLAPTDSAELHNLPLVIHVRCKKRTDTGEIANEIKGYSKREQAAPAGATASVANSTPPWKRS